MRIFRTVATGLLATLVGLGVAVAGPTTASNAQAKVERVITERRRTRSRSPTTPSSSRARSLNPQVDGTLLPYQGKVMLHQEGLQELQVQDRPQGQGQREGRLQDAA